MNVHKVRTICYKSFDQLSAQQYEINYDELINVRVAFGCLILKCIYLMSGILITGLVEMEQNSIFHNSLILGSPWLPLYENI